MKKALFMIMILFGMMMVASGCGSGAKKSEGGVPAVQQGKTAQSEQAAKPGESAGVVIAGEVSSINGSEIVLKLIDMPQPNPQGRQNMGQQNENPRPDDTQNKNNPNGNSQPQPGNPPGEGGKGNNANQPSKELELKYTGETKTVTIPDGVEITAFERGEKGGEQKTLTLDEIKVGDILRIWYSDENMSNISKVSVMRKTQN